MPGTASSDERKMALHLVKLCAGVGSVEDLKARIGFRLGQVPHGHEARVAHVTRMMPKRADELLDGGSIYWVIKGSVQCRQRLLEVVPFVDAEGVGRCRLVLDPELVPTQWHPRRAFQGWRYLKAEEAPADLSSSDEKGIQALPVEMRHELAALGLL